MQYRAGKLLQAGIASNTQLTYATGLKAFKNFCKEYNLPLNWPASEQHIILFIARSFENGLSPNSITTYIAGINYYHKLNNWYDIQKIFVIQKLLEGCRRARTSKDPRAPISKNVLIDIVSILPKVCYNDYETSLFGALFTMAYFGLFRVSELVSSGQDAKHNIQSSDIQFNSDNVIITLNYHKTNQRGRQINIKLPSDNNKTVCPINAGTIFRKNRPQQSGSFFCHANGTEVTRQQFSKVLSKCISKTTFANGHYRSHSFRIGRATDLAVQGIPNDTIMALGRWNSDCFKRYIRL